jgi:DNA-binding response OmpR family regulator
MSTRPKMLIVKDNLDDLDLLKRALTRLSVDVEYEVATDGDAAVEALERASDPDEQVPRVVLLDLKLPRRSGFEILEWMRSASAGQRVPVVVLTSSDNGEDLARAYDLGANSYLVKPVVPAALNAIVKQIDAYWLKLNTVAS